MEAKLDCEVDVEGPADMMDRGEEEGSISRRPCSSLVCALIQPTAPCLEATSGPMCVGLWHVAVPCCL